MDEQAIGNELPSEESVNAAAADEIAATPAAPEQLSQSDVAKPVVADPASVQKTAPLKSSDAGQSAFDAQKSYQEMQKQLAETRKWATQQSQARASFEKQLAEFKKQNETLAKQWAEANEAPFNLEQFNKDFVKNGFKAFDPYLEKKLSGIREQYESKFAEQNAALDAVRNENLVIQHRGDTKNFPNFAELEPKMVEILQSPDCPIDKNLPPDQKLRAVYNLAKNSNSEEAVKAAQKSGYNKAQAELAKEARTAVATGGKGVSSSPADLRNMDFDKMQKLIEQNFGFADRD